MSPGGSGAGPVAAAPARPAAAPALPVPGGRLARLPELLAGMTIAAQIPYPLVTGSARAALTVASVAVFFAASVTHAALTRGAAWTTAFLAVAVGGGLAAEAVGVHTGWPFGRYGYGYGLGARIVGVPVVVPLAWAMMAYPAVLLGHRWAVAVGRAGRVKGRGWVVAVTALAGGATLAGWDLFLDPQMVAERYWSWAQDGPALNGIPLMNAAGWLLVGTVLTGLAAMLPWDAGNAATSGTSGTKGTGGETRVGGVPGLDVPMVLLGWTYISSVLANLAFFGRPGVALAGGLGMGVPVLGLVGVRAADRPRGRSAPRREAPAALAGPDSPGRPA